MVGKPGKAALLASRVAIVQPVMVILLDEAGKAALACEASAAAEEGDASDDTGAGKENCGA